MRVWMEEFFIVRLITFVRNRKHPSLTDAGRVLLVKFETVGGATRLILVALAHIESGQLVSDELLDGVQAIKDSTADTERLLNSLGLTSNA